MVQPQVRVGVVIAIVSLCASPMAQSPSPGAAKPAFEVASVKPNKSSSGGMSWAEQPGGRLTALNMSVAMIIRNAFELQEPQLVGLPDWGSSERFDIVAKAEQEFPRTNDTPSLSQLMVQSLLEERFRLRSHRETRELPAFALVVARADGQLGPQLKASTVDCLALAAARRAGTAPAPVPGARPPCGMRNMNGMMIGGNITMGDLAATLSGSAGRQVVDRTGLKGGFDIDLTFSREQSADTTIPSVFTAVQEQLGLKLDSVRLPTDVLVVDSIERPTPD